MRCIHCQSSILPLFLQLKPRQQLDTPKLLRLTSYERTTTLHGQNIPTIIHARTEAVNTSLVLGVTAPAESGDITVLLQIGAVLFFVYWIANFVVPDIISKDLQFNKTSEDQRPNGDNLTKDKK